MVVSALFRWPCSISIHLSPRYVTAGVGPFPLAMQHFYSLVSQVCHCWCPPFSAGHAAFLFICFPGLSLLVSALFRWPCSISIHLSARSVSAGVRPFPLAMQHFYSFVSQVCHCWCPPFSAGHAAFLLLCIPGLSLLASAGHAAFLFICLPLAVQHFYSFVSQVCHCWRPLLSAGHASFLFICLPCELVSILVGHCVGLSPFCILLSPFLFPFLLSLAILDICLPALGCCVCLCLYMCLPALDCGVRPSCWPLCPACLPSVSFRLPSCLHSSPELGDKWKGLQGKGWHPRQEGRQEGKQKEPEGDKPDTLTNKEETRPETKGEGGHNDQQESLTCVPQLWTAVSTSASESFTFVTQLWAAVSASAWQFFTFVCCCLHPCLAILYICLPVSTFVFQLRTVVSASALQSFVSQLWTSQTLVAECSDFEKRRLFGVYGGIIWCTVPL